MDGQMDGLANESPYGEIGKSDKWTRRKTWLSLKKYLWRDRVDGEVIEDVPLGDRRTNPGVIGRSNLQILLSNCKQVDAYIKQRKRKKKKLWKKGGYMYVYKKIKTYRYYEET